MKIRTKLLIVMLIPGCVCVCVCADWISILSGRGSSNVY